MLAVLAVCIGCAVARQGSRKTSWVREMIVTWIRVVMVNERGNSQILDKLRVRPTGYADRMDVGYKSKSGLRRKPKVLT